MIHSSRVPSCSPSALKGDAPAYINTGVLLRSTLCTAPAIACPSKEISSAQPKRGKERKTYLRTDIDMHKNSGRASRNLCVPLGRTEGHHLIGACYDRRLGAALALVGVECVLAGEVLEECGMVGAPVCKGVGDAGGGERLEEEGRCRGHLLGEGEAGIESYLDEWWDLVVRTYDQCKRGFDSWPCARRPGLNSLDRVGAS